MSMFVYREAQNVIEHRGERRASCPARQYSRGSLPPPEKQSRACVGYREGRATSSTRKQVNSHLTGGTCMREQCVMAIITIAFQREAPTGGHGRRKRRGEQTSRNVS